MTGVLRKLAKEGIENVGDFLKSFRKKTYYHISPNPDIEEFEINQLSSFGDNETRGAIYFTSDPKYTEDILEELESIWGDDKVNPPRYTTYPVKIKKGKIFNFNDKQEVKKLEAALSNEGYNLGPFLPIKYGAYETLEQPEIQKILKEQGYRGYMTSEPGTVGLFYPEDVRSIFGKFNPEDAKSSNILKAVVPVGALNLLGATDGESEN